MSTTTLADPAPGSALGSFLLPEGYRRPPVVAAARESRIVVEAGRYAAGAVVRRRPARPAARTAEPVLLVPGIFAGDYSLAALHRELRAAGHRTYRSRIRCNVACTLEAATRLEARLEEIAARRESRVRVVGHSLGGMLARGIAVRRPDLVAGIVTLGSPMRAPGAHTLALTAGIGALVGLSRAGVPGLMAHDCVAGECARTSFAETQQPVPDGVDFTAVFSRRDGIVDWRACIDPGAEQVEVSASHIGLACDPAVVRIVLDRLAGAAVPGSVLEVDRGVGA